MCHQEEWFRNESIDCVWQGRILPIAYDFGRRTLCDMREEISEWSINGWGGDSVFFFVNSKGQYARPQRVEF